MSINPAVLEHFPESWRAQAEKVLSASPYLQEQLTKYPHWAAELPNSVAYAEGELAAKVARELESVPDEVTLMQSVRQIRHRETVRIAWRDLSGAATLVETLRTTSDLADALVGSVLDWWHRQLVIKEGTPRSRTGTPQHLLVLGMGKLGGRELNFSSDIDLIFTYPEAGETDGRRALDNQTYFIRLGQKLINTLGQVTSDGFAYRVDMRLRPFGESGALALSFDAMEHYYQTHGREWERYALIKARVMAGDPAEGDELMARLRPFIYRRYLDYGAVEQLREMKMMINREAQRKGKQQDVKLGKGGIREIEFTAQLFQLMRGGRMRVLQERSLLATLDVLEANELLPAEDSEALRQAYVFLRRTENRGQMWKDEQVHALPSEPEQQQQLAGSMGFADWAAFMAALDGHRAAVAAIFQRVFVVEDEEKLEHKTFHLLWTGQMDEQSATAVLSSWGYESAPEVLLSVQHLRESRVFQSLTDVGRNRLDRLMPFLLMVCAVQAQPNQALERSLQVIQAVARRSGYVAMLADHPAALEQFVKLVHASAWMTAQITQHPILLDTLLDIRHLYNPLNRQELGSALQHELASVDPDDTGLVMERLRQFKQAQVLRVAAADVTGLLPLMVVSDQLTWIAEAILEHTSGHVWQTLTSKSGVPCYVQDGASHEAGFAIVAYGKLGGIELGYGSDLDIVFLHDSRGEQQSTRGAKPLENPVFFARLAQKIIHALSTYTHDGRLYEIDTRLRPSGSAGLLVTSLAAFQQYQVEKAWIWEHQALLRARVIFGSAGLQAGFEQMRREILCQPRDRKLLRTEVVHMRQKMWDALGSRDPTAFNLKKDPGGITDIEFMVQYLLLAHAHEYPELVRWSDNIRQLDSLRESGILSAEAAGQLQGIYRTLRNRVHELALQEQEAVVEAGAFVAERESVQAFWGEVFGGVE